MSLRRIEEVREEPGSLEKGNINMGLPAVTPYSMPPKHEQIINMIK